MKPWSLLLILTLGAPTLVAAITAGQVDDFQDGTLQGWTSGINNPNGPVNEQDAGPDGTGDRAFVATATGAAGPGGSLVVFNKAQWTGNYTAAGVVAIRADLANLGDTGLTIRAVVSGSGGPFATHAVSLSADGAFVTAVFSVRASDLTYVGLAEPNVANTLANVTEVRLLHSASPAFRGARVAGTLAIDNITAADSLACVTKTDQPADFLLLPGFEVDTNSPQGLTTFFSVRNQTDEDRTARVQYFDRQGRFQLSEDLALGPHQTRSRNVRQVAGLAAEADGFLRGWFEILACGEEGVLTGNLTGDYFFLDGAGDFATGDQLLRREDLCDTLQVRLVNFGSGVRLRLYGTAPQGAADPTAQFTVYNEAGTVIDSGPFFMDDSVEVFDSSTLTAVSFGTLVIDFLEGKGAMVVELSAFGRFSVAMNAICIEP